MGDHGADASLSVRGFIDLKKYEEQNKCFPFKKACVMYRPEMQQILETPPLILDYIYIYISGYMRNRSFTEMQLSFTEMQLH